MPPEGGEGGNIHFGSEKCMWYHDRASLIASWYGVPPIHRSPRCAWGLGRGRGRGAPPQDALAATQRRNGRAFQSHRQRRWLTSWSYTTASKRPSRRPSPRIASTAHPNVMVYADDLVILHHDRSVIEHCHHLVSEWLRPLGLTLKPSKTPITHTLETPERPTRFRLPWLSHSTIPGRTYYLGQR